jgi:hypothetical protein
MTDERKPYAPPTLTNLSADVVKLAARLRELGETPAGRALIRGLEHALPEASAEVRGALANPAATLGALLETLTRPAVGELADSDQAIARGLARALGRGLARGAKRGG